MSLWYSVIKYEQEWGDWRWQSTIVHPVIVAVMHQRHRCRCSCCTPAVAQQTRDSQWCQDIISNLSLLGFASHAPVVISCTNISATPDAAVAQTFDSWWCRGIIADDAAASLFTHQIHHHHHYTLPPPSCRQASDRWWYPDHCLPCHRCQQACALPPLPLPQSPSCRWARDRWWCRGIIAHHWQCAQA